MFTVFVFCRILPSNLASVVYTSGGGVPKGNLSGGAKRQFKEG